MIAAVAWALCLLGGLGLAVAWLATVLDRPHRAPGRHRATGADLHALRGADVLAQQRAAGVAAQQRMADAVRRETGR